MKRPAKKQVSGGRSWKTKNPTVPYITEDGPITRNQLRYLVRLRIPKTLALKLTKVQAHAVISKVEAAIEAAEA